MILIISPIIFSLGYFIFFQPIINYPYIKFFLVILINVIFLTTTNKQHQLTQAKDTTLDCERLTPQHTGDGPRVPF